MKRLALCLVAMLAFEGYLMGQQSTPAVRAPSPLHFSVGVSWYHPNLGTFNDGFRALEDAMGYEPWTGDRMDYSISADARWRFRPEMDVLVEGAGTYVYRMRKDDRSFNSLWRFGAGYRIGVPVSSLEAFGRVSAGMAWASFSRSYNSDAIRINAAKTTWYVSLGAGASYSLLSRTSIEGSLQYVIMPTLHLAAPAADAKLGAFSAGVNLVLQLP